MAEPFALAPSLWAATAAPAPPAPPLQGDTRADVCIVGAGYAGLSTALHLAERGIDAIVLEAHEPGWGGSGRNGGQVIPGIKYDPDELAKMFPGDAGERLARFAGGTADLVFDLIDRHRMDVPHVRAGWIQGAHTPAGVELVRSRARQWAARGVAGARFLDRAEVAAQLGTDKYLAGWIDPRGGGVQPLGFARGLARAAIAVGARVHGDSAVRRLTRAGARWQVATDRGQVDAERAICGPRRGTPEAVARDERWTANGARQCVKPARRTAAAERLFRHRHGGRANRRGNDAGGRREGPRRVRSARAGR